MKKSAFFFIFTVLVMGVLVVPEAHAAGNPQEMIFGIIRDFLDLMLEYVGKFLDIVVDAIKSVWEPSD